ncbi:MAG: phosphatase PAP2 family protein [bacterium]|nr:phosphatase PAP2 family protein [bacterium]
MGFPNWAKNILFLLVYMISGLVLVIIIEGLLSGSDLTPLNTAIENVVVQVRTPLLTTLLVWMTKIGNPFILASVSVFMAVMLILRRNAYDAVLFLTTMIIAVLSLTVLKNVFQISRPISDIYSADGWSFPSGHATVATAFFFMLSHTFFGKMKTLRAKTILIVGSVVGTLLICFSRLYLGAHWTLDILAGIALGLLAVSFTVLMFNVFLSNRRSLRKRLNL